MLCGGSITGDDDSSGGGNVCAGSITIVMETAHGALMN